MRTNLRAKIFGLAVGLCLLAVSHVDPATLEASYQFTDTFSPDQSGVTSITPVDPLSQGFFMTDTVFGQTDQVYRFDGSTNRGISSAANGGLTLNTTGLITNPEDYTLHIVFSLDDFGHGNFNRVLDVSDRTNDGNAIYQNSNDRLSSSGGDLITPPFATGDGQYHNVVLVVARGGA